MFKEAVDLYLDIAKESPMKNYLLAVEAQSRLAAWTTQPNFDKAGAGDANERSKLLSIFESISQLKNGEDWSMLAHIGLLNRALGQNQKAEDLWMKGLKSNMASKLAMEAGGLLISEFYTAKRWADVIDLSHMFGTKKAVPTSKGKSIKYQPWLADALYNGGIADLQAQNFPRSVKYLEEFAQVFGSDTRIAAATYSLAFAYKGTGKMLAALNACKIVVEKYPRYNLRPKLMLQAAEWGAADKTTWEYAFFFYSKYLTDYKNERNIPDIRNTLADLYLKRKLYGWAARLYKEQSLAPNVSKEQQLTAAVKYMDIEEQYGEPKDAYAGALRIIQLTSPKDPAALHALAFMGRYVANNKDLKGMAEIEPKLLSFSKSSKEVQEAVGLIRFRRAELQTRTIVYTENNLLIKDPEGIVKKYFDVFEVEKQHYLKVCQVGISAYCAPAMLRLTTVARQGIEAMEKVAIAETLEPNRVNSFKVFRQLHLSRVQKARNDFIDQALKLAKAGTTTPIWKDEIMKTLEYADKTDVAH
jgi:tetratricopeptide (TPR) repeat protein